LPLHQLNRPQVAADDVVEQTAHIHVAVGRLGRLIRLHARHERARRLACAAVQFQHVHRFFSARCAGTTLPLHSAGAIVSVADCRHTGPDRSFDRWGVRWLAAMGQPPHNLPARLPPLIGRDHALVGAATLLVRDDVAKVTLTGTLEPDGGLRLGTSPPDARADSRAGGRGAGLRGLIGRYQGPGGRGRSLTVRPGGG
jgi:hypothetical protein